MHFTSLLATSCAFLTTTVSAAPAFTADSFLVTNLTLQRIETANATLTFTVTDPDPLSNQTTTCTGTWPYGSAGWPEETYDACTDTDFAWNIASFNSWTDFQLGVQHTIRDPSIGEPPYDQVTNFGKGSFNSTVVSCSAMGGREICQQATGTTVPVPITSTIAKRR